MKCFYHNDADGKCAAAIVRKVFDEKVIEFIEVSYEGLVPVDKIQQGERIFIVDYSFKPDLMNEILEKTVDVVWIDHHITAINNFSYSKKVPGLRSVDFSGCELTWKFLNPEEEMPMSVKLIGDRDTWKFKFKESSKAFGQGLKTYSHGPEDRIWKTLLTVNRDSVIKVQQIINEGKICIKYRDSVCRDYVKSFGFITEFEGYTCLAAGINYFGSDTFASQFHKYPICITFETNGKMWVIRLYSKTINVGSIALRYGGGGHNGAAGFNINELPFLLK